MPDDPNARRTIVDRADRMVRQSRRLRKIADELLKESSDLKAATKSQPAAKRRKRPKR
jgi:hypothetical protein